VRTRLVDSGLRSARALGALAGLALLLPASAAAKAHHWRFSEFFSNADGSVQFVELVECCGSGEETNISGWELRSNANTWIFPHDLSGDTTHQHLLVATQSFAELPGAPTPDFIIPPQFFDPASDQLTYRVHDTVVVTAMPVDGLHSVDRDGNVRVNDPTNLAGETGTIGLATPTAPALEPASLGVLVLALAWLGSRLAFRRGRRAASAGQATNSVRRSSSGSIFSRSTGGSPNTTRSAPASR